MRFRIDLKIFLFIILFYFTKQVDIYALIMIFAIIHEMGHLLMGILVKMKPNKLEIMPFGVTVSFKLKPKDYNVKIKKSNLLELKKIIVAMAGPMTNVIIAIITYNLKIDYQIKNTIIYSNILIIIFNLLPIYPLDGGRILSSILHIFCGKKIAEKSINNISIVVALILTVLVSIVIINIHNIAILIALGYIWILVIKEKVLFENRQNLYRKIDKITLENYKQNY